MFRRPLPLKKNLHPPCKAGNGRADEKGRRIIHPAPFACCPCFGQSAFFVDDDSEVVVLAEVEVLSLFLSAAGAVAPSSFFGAGIPVEDFPLLSVT